MTIAPPVNVRLAGGHLQPGHAPSKPRRETFARSPQEE